MSDITSYKFKYITPEEAVKHIKIVQDSLVVTFPNPYLSYTYLTDFDSEGVYRTQLVLTEENNFSQKLLQEVIYQLAERKKKGLGDIAVNDLLTSLKDKGDAGLSVPKSYHFHDLKYTEEELEEKKEQSKGLIDKGGISFTVQTPTIYTFSDDKNAPKQVKKSIKEDVDPNQTTMKPNIYISSIPKGSDGKPIAVPATPDDIANYCHAGLKLRAASVTFYLGKHGNNTYISKRLHSVLLSRSGDGNIIQTGTSIAEGYDRFVETAEDIRRYEESEVEYNPESSLFNNKSNT